jgi:rhodanese-related sulfurtransferase
MHSLPADLQRFEDLANDARLVILGHQGVRSLQVVSWLGLQGLENCFSLAGGTTGGVARLTRLYRTTEPSERR